MRGTRPDVCCPIGTPVGRRARANDNGLWKVSRVCPGKSMSRWPAERASWAVIIALTASTLAGLLASIVPNGSLLILAAVLPLMLVSATRRLVTFMLGSLLVFGSSAGLSPAKIAFLGVSLLIVVIAVRGCVSRLTAEESDLISRALKGSALIVVFVAIFATVGILNGASPVSIGRDAITYLLIAMAIPIAIDSACDLPPGRAILIVVAVSGAAAASFAATYLSARDIGQLEIERLLLPSLALTGLGFAVSIALALGQKRLRSRWLLVALALVFSLLVTGTRTGVVLFSSLLGIFWGKESGRPIVWRTLVAITTLAVVGVVLLVYVSPFVAETDVVIARLRSLTTFLEQGVVVDASALTRLEESRIALSFYHESPIFGAGFGANFFPLSGETPTSFYLDTPALYLAKFGWVGSGVLLGALAFIFRSLVADYPGNKHRAVARMSVMGGSFFFLCVLPLSAITEDKGFAVAVGCLVLLVVSLRLDEPRDRHSRSVGKDGVIEEVV